MKKYFPIAITSLAIFTVMFASCNTKDYSCTCTYNTNGAIQTVVTTIPNVTKKDAQDQCGTGKYAHPGLGAGVSYTGNTKITCKL